MVSEPTKARYRFTRAAVLYRWKKHGLAEQLPQAWMTYVRGLEMARVMGAPLSPMLQKPRTRWRRNLDGTVSVPLDPDHVTVLWESPRNIEAGFDYPYEEYTPLLLLLVRRLRPKIPGHVHIYVGFKSNNDTHHVHILRKPWWLVPGDMLQPPFNPPWFFKALAEFEGLPPENLKRHIETAVQEAADHKTAWETAVEAAFRAGERLACYEAEQEVIRLALETGAVHTLTMWRNTLQRAQRLLQGKDEDVRFDPSMAGVDKALEAGLRDSWKEAGIEWVKDWLLVQIDLLEQATKTKFGV